MDQSLLIFTLCLLCFIGGIVAGIGYQTRKEATREFMERKGKGMKAIQDKYSPLFDNIRQRDREQQKRLQTIEEAGQLLKYFDTAKQLKEKRTELKRLSGLDKEDKVLENQIRELDAALKEVERAWGSWSTPRRPKRAKFN